MFGWLSRQRKPEVSSVLALLGHDSITKGIGTLIDVIAALDTMNSQCTWRITGVGQEGKRELEKKLGYTRLKVYTSLSRGELKDLYNQMNVFLCLSTYESFGMVCSEAMALRCILLSTEVGFAYGLKKLRISVN